MHVVQIVYQISRRVHIIILRYTCRFTASARYRRVRVTRQCAKTQHALPLFACGNTLGAVSSVFTVDFIGGQSEHGFGKKSRGNDVISTAIRLQAFDTRKVYRESVRFRHDRYRATYTERPIQNSNWTSLFVNAIAIYPDRD